MSATTLFGREAPKSKRIDVEANLLEDWVAERRGVKSQALLRAGFLLVLGIGGFWGIRTLNRVNGDLAIDEKTAATRLRLLGNPRAMASGLGGVGQTAKHNADATVSQVIGLLNSATPSMALSSLKVDVLGGEVRLSGQADAENEYTAAEFLRQNGNPIRVGSSRSDLLAKSGVSFQFLKKVEIGE